MTQETFKGQKSAPFHFSTPDKEGNYSASKWLNIQVLLDGSEMKELMEHLSDCYIVPVGRVIQKDEYLCSKEDFVSAYMEYTEALKEGKELSAHEYQSWFSCAITTSLDDFYAIDVDKNQMLVRVQRPVIQMQPHSLGYSDVDFEIRPMVRGPEAISWGIQFSYPQVYQEAPGKEAIEVMKDRSYGNTKLFLSIQKWLRNKSRPTPFLVRDRDINVSIRLGNQAFSWINNHHQLRMLGIIVDVDREED